jgi:hypothetical protein
MLWQTLHACASNGHTEGAAAFLGLAQQLQHMRRVQLTDEATQRSGPAVQLEGSPMLAELPVEVPQLIMENISLRKLLCPFSPTNECVFAATQRLEQDKSYSEAKQSTSEKSEQNRPGASL